MVAWRVSRHPEWDLMYLAGLTAREIADRCHKGVATVHLHLRMREKYEPGFEEKHRTALAARGPNRPTTKWRNRVIEANDFYARMGHLPASNGGPAERSLHAWLAEQRRQFHRGLLPEAKFVLLAGLKGWDEEPRQYLDEVWRTKLANLIEFIEQNGRIPQYRNYSSEREHVLGVWLHNQHQRRSANTLKKWRLEELNNAWPDWRSRR